MNAVTFCNSKGISITARGRGHSIEGQSCGSGLILDMSTFNKVIRMISANVLQPNVMTRFLKWPMSMWRLKEVPSKSFWLLYY